MGGRTEYLFLQVNGGKIKRLEPLWQRRSRTGNHGEDCYTVTFLQKADVEVAVKISNSGAHYCSLRVLKPLAPEQLLRLARWLQQHEHLCHMIAQDLIRYGLPPKTLTDLLQHDP